MWSPDTDASARTPPQAGNYTLTVRGTGNEPLIDPETGNLYLGALLKNSPYTILVQPGAPAAAYSTASGITPDSKPGAVDGLCAPHRTEGLVRIPPP